MTSRSPGTVEMVGGGLLNFAEQQVALWTGFRSLGRAAALEHDVEAFTDGQVRHLAGGKPV
jgi:hypothetical protein